MAGASTYQRIDKIQIQENKKIIFNASTRTCLVEADVANNKAHLGAILRGNVPGTTSTRVFCVLGKHKGKVPIIKMEIQNGICHEGGWGSACH